MNTCLTCINGYYLLKDQCVAQCPEKYEIIERNMTCLYVGFVCPENYNYNEDRTGCIPSARACTAQGYVLNSDSNACVPKTGLIVPFPFLIATVFFFFLVLASWLKDR